MSFPDRSCPCPRFAFVPASALILVLACPWAAAAPQEWGVQLGTIKTDYLESAATDGLGGTFEFGASEGALVGPALGSGDLYLARRDASGAVLWQLGFGTSSADGARDMCSDGLGGAFVAGNTYGAFMGPNQGVGDALIARFDGSGNQLWGRQIGTAGNDDASVVAADGAGGVFVAGFSGGALAGPSSGGDDIWLARYDALGNLQWIHQFGSSWTDWVNGIAADGAGGVLLCGTTLGALGGPSAGASDSWYASFDGAGNSNWIRQFGVADHDGAFSILPDGSGGCLVGGQWLDQIMGAPVAVAFLTRFDVSGGVQWNQDLPAPSSTVIDLSPDGLGGLYVLTREFDPPGDVYPGIRQVAADGTVLFHSYFARGTGQHIASSFARDGATGLVVVGITMDDMFGPFQGGNGDGWIARVDTCDYFGFSTYCTGAPNSTGKGASIDRHGSPYVSNNDLVLTVKACPANQLGIFIIGPGQNSTPFGDGILCIGGGVKRLLPAIAMDALGAGQAALDLTDPASPASLITPGSTWNFQFWYRDPAAGGAGFNLSNGLTTHFCP